MVIDKQKLLEQLNALKIFPKSKLVRELQKQIQNKLKKLEKSKTKTKLPKQSQNRSSKLKKYHRYMRMIRNNFPQYSYSDIRHQFSKRRKGSDSFIPDVVWQNPSP